MTGSDKASATVAVTDDSFAEDVLTNDRPVLVDFWAAWCG
ncbi:MAG: thiol reductase thioredoxin, partial [Mycolicibacterium sp.]|nr:thiol reductase thioredoxin [Mycolicibacterium sp.]